MRELNQESDRGIKRGYTVLLNGVFYEAGEDICKGELLAIDDDGYLVSVGNHYTPKKPKKPLDDALYRIGVDMAKSVWPQGLKEPLVDPSIVGYYKGVPVRTGTAVYAQTQCQHDWFCDYQSMFSPSMNKHSCRKCGMKKENFNE